MQLFHNSQSEEWRAPYGAVPTDESVTLRLSVKGGEPDRVLLRMWIDERELLTEMSCAKASEDGLVYAAEVIMPHTAQLVWYYFIAETGGRRIYYLNCADGLGGVGEQTEKFTENSYQITVYERGFHTPDWFKGSIMYQIFPDRFYGEHADGKIPQKREEYHIHNDWYERLSFDRHPYEDGPACNDFFGGNLAGIRAKLPYLKEMGISVIYLNPIFDAYSNHKYDTADYKKIDPMFGSEEDFKLLSNSAEKLGIRIILDGVFSHTGSDSIYFNKYGNYGEGGAWRDRTSPYAEWFDFTDEAPGYSSWWGCSNLPNVKEMTPSYLDYILRDEDSVIKHWIDAGARGWRLDVADELPDEFIKILRREVKNADKDAVVIGEVWEDASNKESYGIRRQYLLGQELDSVMNYLWKDAVIAFLLGRINAVELDRRLQSVKENYPKEVFYSLMNIAGTHDTVRIKSVLGEQEQFEGMSLEQKQNSRLSFERETLALCRVRQMALMQMTYCGVPCIYYGDEIGMQGLSDPFNRMPYTWRQVDPELREYYRRLAELRNKNPFLQTGEIKTVFSCGGIYAYARYDIECRDAFNRSIPSGIGICAVNSEGETKNICFNLAEFGAKKWMDALSEDEFLCDENGRLELSIEKNGGRLLLAV